MEVITPATIKFIFIITKTTASKIKQNNNSLFTAKALFQFFF